MQGADCRRAVYRQELLLLADTAGGVHVRATHVEELCSMQITSDGREQQRRDPEGCGIWVEAPLQQSLERGDTSFTRPLLANRLLHATPVAPKSRSGHRRDLGLGPHDAWKSLYSVSSYPLQLLPRPSSHLTEDSTGGHQLQCRGRRAPEGALPRVEKQAMLVLRRGLLEHKVPDKFTDLVGLSPLQFSLQAGVQELHQLGTLEILFELRRVIDVLRLGGCGP
mmetsp:Transcript_38691/g.102813  ORF Transcript_38691/g.102813 Transcript_38691/m.102813 type:complete len:223 (-) Transcript_38691:211-879(-)